MILKSDAEKIIEIIRVDNNIYTIVDLSNISFINKINSKGEISDRFISVDSDLKCNINDNFYYYDINDAVSYLLSYDNIINFKLLPNKLKDCILLRKLQE